MIGRGSANPVVRLIEILRGKPRDLQTCRGTVDSTHTITKIEVRRSITLTVETIALPVSHGTQEVPSLVNELIADEHWSGEPEPG